MNIKEGDMFILSQNKEKLYNLSGHIEGIGYEETKEYTKGKKEDKIRHTLMVYDGCCEEVAEYETKEDCMLILYAVFKTMEQGTNALELPTQEETAKQKELMKQFIEAGGEIAKEATELLKEMFKG